jgi:hypothetical protein
MADGFDLGALLKMVGPVLGGLAAPGSGGQAGFQQGWMHGADLAKQEQDQKVQQTHVQNQQGAEYLMRIADHAQNFDDPVALDQFLSLAEDAGTKAGYIKPGDLKGRITIPPSKIAKLRLQELTDQLGTYEKNGYNLDDLSNAGAVLALKDGSQVPVKTALDLTRARPLDAVGQPVAKPQKADTTASTEEERFVQKWAKDQGKKFTDLTAAEELQARKQFRESGRPDQRLSPGGVDAQFNDLVDIWKQAHPGQEPPANVRTVLRKQANAVNDKPLADNAAKLSPEGLDYAATLYRVTNVMPALGQRSNEDRAAVVNAAAQQAKALGQTPAVAIQRQAAYKGDANALKRMQAASASAESFENKALQQADLIDGLSKKVDRTQYPLINNALQAGRTKLLGDSNAQQLANAIETFTAEYAKIIEGATGSAAGSSDSARRAASRLLNAGMNKGTLADTLNLMRREMRLTVQGYGATIDHITTRMGGQPSSSTTPLSADELIKKYGR